VDAADQRSDCGNETDNEEKMEVGCGDEGDMEQVSAPDGERRNAAGAKEGSHKSKDLTHNTGSATVSEKAKRFIAENRVGSRGGAVQSKISGKDKLSLRSLLRPPLKRMTIYGTEKLGAWGTLAAMDSAQSQWIFHPSFTQLGLPGPEYRTPLSSGMHMDLKGWSAAWSEGMPGSGLTVTLAATGQ
jgi:hypothetical protein